MKIYIENLKKIYKMGNIKVKALNGVNLTVEDRSFLTIMGRSGSGKSTLLNMIGCLDQPDEGQIIFGDENITNLKKSELPYIRREKIGFIFQNYNLLPTLTALENVILPLRYKKSLKQKAKTMAADMLEKVGLKDRINHLPRELSGGEQQRVAIARALINNPAVVLADEPTGSVDTQTAREIVNLMRELHLKNQQTFIIVSHDPIIGEASDLIVNMGDGRILS